MAFCGRPRWRWMTCHSFNHVNILRIPSGSNPGQLRKRTYRRSPIRSRRGFASRGLTLGSRIALDWAETAVLVVPCKIPSRLSWATLLLDLIRWTRQGFEPAMDRVLRTCGKAMLHRQGDAWSGGWGGEVWGYHEGRNQNMRCRRAQQAAW